MGGGGSKMSDLFYPDNPYRRARAEQLRDDVQFICKQFEEAKEERNQLLKAIKPKLNDLMKKHGFNTTDELDSKVQAILKGDALKEYIRVKEQMDKNDEFIHTIFQITTVIGAATGIFLGALVIAGIMTGGAALSALGLIGSVLGAIAVVAVLLSVFEGKEERAASHWYSSL
ncbi:hypothetical protein AMATHDRAFT_4885 [Amanita thiersii Skay4041]|uniref:Uncharacterized protein n=1 Tax=Amanita thiersii Skay4041 TaxID=703135 RepID=A0A2A9NM88_9AGAR|nr:hypothetical protein AMATHDRAFT_4885 [Amanita thiersii Skay4041]